MSKNYIWRSALLTMLGVVGCAHAALADEHKQRIDIPAGELSVALQMLAKQSGADLVYRPEQVQGLQTKGVQGDLTTQDAIARLLEGTALKLRTDSTGAMLIAAPLAPSANASKVSTMRLAQAQQVSAGEQASKQATEESASERAVPEILVKDSRILNMDIKRSRDDAQPYVVFERKEIENSGVRNIEDFLKQRLPMNSTAFNNNQAESRGGNTSTVNLRGLGSRQTLILVDGHRLVSQVNQGTASQSDLNGIPLSAIERIEVLPTTASGIYGGSATGGVVNVILRRDYVGSEAKVTYENTFDNDAYSRRIDFSSGFTLEEGKTTFMIAGAYSKDGDLLNGERDFMRSNRERRLANLGGNARGLNIGGAIPLQGYTTNINSTLGGNLTLKGSNTPLNSSVTFVPVGYAGPGSDGGQAFVTNAGKYNLDLPNSRQTYGSGSTLIQTPELKTLSMSARRHFSERVDAFVDLAASRNVGTSNFSNAFGSYALAAGAAGNPFNEAINIMVPISATDGGNTYKSENMRAIAGVIVKLPKNWSFGMDYNWNKVRRSFTGVNGVFTGGEAAAISSGALQVFRDVNAFPVDYSAYILNAPDQYGEFPITLDDVTARASGPLFSLPGGAVTLSTSVEYRIEDIKEAYTYINNIPGVVSLLTPQRDQTVKSAYVEALVPLVSARNAKRGVRELELQLALRHDRYATDGVTGSVRVPSTTVVERLTSEVSSTDPTIGLRYQPIRDLVLRASYGTGFIPPIPTQLLPGNPTPNVTSGLDPRRGSSQAGPYTNYPGGNPSVKPEKSESYSAGLIFQPHALPGLRFSADYTRIEKTDNILSPTPQQVIDNEALFPDRVQRAASCPGDPYAPVCPIVGLITRAVNLSTARLENIDYSLDYNWDTATRGNFGAYVLATQQLTYKTQLVPQAAVLENVGYSQLSTLPVEWRVNVGLNWSRGSWRAGWSARYFDSYLVANPTSATFASLAAAQGNGGKIDSQTIHDVYVGYEGDQSAPGWLSRTGIQLGLKNVLNEKPAFDVSSQVVNGLYSPLGDARLRMYSISLKHAF